MTTNHVVIIISFSHLDDYIQINGSDYCSYRTIGLNLDLSHKMS